MKKFSLLTLSIFLFACILTMQGAIPFTYAQTAEQIRQQQLQAELDAIEKQIADQQKILASKRSEGSSISRDIAILNAQIAEAKLKIKAHSLAIQRLGKDIVTKQEVIGDLSEKIVQGQKSIAQILQQTDELDHYTSAGVFLSGESFSEFFEDLGNFDALHEDLHQYFGQVKTAKQETEAEKERLDQKRNQEIALKINVETEQANIQKNEKEKQRLLSLNKQEQKNYQSVIDVNQKKAAAIRDALFSLRDSSAIKFGVALEYAKIAGAKTGVRPAFLLAILTQETNLGANIGSCYLTNEAGDGIKIKSGAAVSEVMKPSRDVAPFLALMKDLGRDPYKTPISCPQSTGYGGGMGPSQFIPSTWALMKNQIAAATGKTVPDPFNPSDAFMASALYLSNLGADGSNPTSEKNAACKYYSGKSCTTNAYNGFYGNSVMKIAEGIQANINILQNNQLGG